MSIYKKIFILSAVLLTIASFSGCETTRISTSEVMQQPKGTKYYLAHNLWTNGRHKISSINYQYGSVLPFGTQVKVLEVTSNEIRFQVIPGGHKYTIKYYEQYAMEPIQEYLKKLITTENRAEMTKDTSPEFLDAMLRGEVRPGMTRKEVILTYGPPSPHRTPSQLNPTWVYWLRRWPVSITSRVIFKGDKVLQVMR
jgi:outer membrane protein assembly factor BamE (lipoprotein component of BamABCDE complex)